jgi:hypothetical protein
MGTHRRLAMEVVDDMKLGKLVKEAGIRSGVARAGDAVSVHWHAGIGNMILGTTKNFFATTGFRLDVVALQIADSSSRSFSGLRGCLSPMAWARFFALIAIVLPVIAMGGCVPGIRRLARSTRSHIRSGR